VTPRRQLILFSLTLLVLPGLTFHYIRDSEQTLLEQQQTALQRSATLIAQVLSTQPEQLYGDSGRIKNALNLNSLYAPQLTQPPALDGNLEDWQNQWQRQFGSDKRPLQVYSGIYGGQLYLGIRARELTRRWNRADSAQADGDRLILTLWQEPHRLRYAIANSEPGPLAPALLDNHRQTTAPGIFGYWSETPDDNIIELAIPLETLKGRLGLYYVDVDDGGVSIRGNLRPTETAAPPELIAATQTLMDSARWQVERGAEVVITDRWGWPLNTFGTQLPKIDTTEPTPATSSLWDRILKRPSATEWRGLQADGRLVNLSVSNALRGQGSAALQAQDDETQLSYAAPIRHSELGVIGVVQTTLPLDVVLDAAHSLHRQLWFYVLGGLGLISAVFLGYALGAHQRLHLLIKAAERRREQRDRQLLPTDPRNDEINALAREFNRLLREQDDTQDYLRSLPRTLAHEIRTPIAIVNATLEQLVDAKGEQRETLLKRGREGLTRLSNLLDAMNEANRLEQAPDESEYQETDLNALLTDLSRAYGSSYSDFSIVYASDSAEAKARVAPERLVQALDKLIANAVSFSQERQAIELRLEHRGLWWRLSVINAGPALPEPTDNLFQPMVSHRQRAESQGHLGLGLYVVALIARHHGGEPWAQNREEEKRVEVGFTVRA